MLCRPLEPKGTCLKVGDPAKFLLTESSRPMEPSTACPETEQNGGSVQERLRGPPPKRGSATASEDAAAARRRDMAATARHGRGQCTCRMSAARQLLDTP